MVLTGWLILFFPLTPVTEFVGVVRAEISVTPNVALMRREKQILLNISRQKCDGVHKSYGSRQEVISI